MLWYASQPGKDSEAQNFLIKCLVHAPKPVAFDLIYAKRDIQYCMSLKKDGILMDAGDDCVRFSSPVAKRYFSM